MPAFIQSRETPTADHDHVVAVTRLTVRSPRTLFAVLRRLGGILRQMQRTDGLVVFGLRAQLLRLTFSTYGVFQGRRELAEFLSTGAHGETMIALKGRLHHVEARTLVRSGAELPHGWAAIDALLDEVPATRESSAL